MKVIEAHGLTKKYTLGGLLHDNSLRDVITQFFGRRGESRRDTILAVNDVSFSIDEGERVGVIGRNGSGKSTLLKILSRITRPTAGRATIRGQVGSLLEVGTGFHPELSGRENIYLNGAVLGMKRTEIEKKFDEIVAFSEIERFLDTPAKHYSSGMYMRLAFSVAAHLDPDVLIVDEVLAVGDAAFQRKCLTKMREVGESGRTVLFVSHDMSAVTRLCSRAMWLKNGQLVADGDARASVSAYLHEQATVGPEAVWDASSAPGGAAARLLSLRALDADNSPAAAIPINSPICVEMTYEVLTNDKVMVPALHFFDEQGTCILVSYDWHSGWGDKTRRAGVYTSRAEIPANFFSNGAVFVGASLSTDPPREVHFDVRDAITFNLVEVSESDTARGNYTGPMPGVVRPMLEWETKAG